MNRMSTTDAASATHSHVFLGEGHEKHERRTWMVIALCTVMMVAEIVGGLLFGSIALVADGLHMSTHASALLLAALAYSYARRHANDERFSFGTARAFGVLRRIDDMQPDVILDHLGHQAVHGAARGDDQVQDGGAAFLVLERAFDRLDLAAHAPDPIKQFELLAFGVGHG